MNPLSIILIIFSLLVSSRFNGWGVNLAWANNLDLPDIHIYKIPKELMHDLAASEKGVVFYIRIKDTLVKAEYNGLLDISNGKNCFEISRTCIPNAKLSSAENLGDIESGEYKILDPKSQQSKIGKYIQEGNTETSNELKWPSQMMGTLSDLGSSALSGGLKAGVVAGIVGALGGEELKIAQAKLEKSYQDLSDSQAYYVESLNHTVKIGEAYQKAMKAFAVLKNQEIDLSLTFSQLGEVNLEVLKTAVAPFDKNYQERAINAGMRINHLPDPRDDYAKNFYALTKGLLLDSVDTRLLGDIDLSEAQLNASVEVLDFIVGLDPLTGTVRSLYEAYTGENIITGESLDDFQRSLTGAFGVLNLTTLGMASTSYAAFKVIQKIYKSSYGTNLQKYLSVSSRTSDLVHLIKSKGIYLSSQLERAHAYVKINLQKNVTPLLTEIGEVLDKGISSKVLVPLKFSKNFINEPYLQESLEYIYNKVSVGAVRAQKIYPGNTDEIYIIGRKMGGANSGVVGVREYREALIEGGYSADKIKIFDSKEIEEVYLELKKKSVELSRYLSLDDLKNTSLWKLNEKFIKEAIGNSKKQPTIIDLGRLKTDTTSHFYDGLELIELSNSGRTLWNPKK